MSALAGTVVGRYRLESLLGVGGMAEVYRAVDGELGRAVAIKVVLPGIASQREFRERFSREARLVAALEHPNIAPIYDVGEHQGRPFLVMPLYEGGSLAARLEGRPLVPALIRRWLSDLAAALDAAHAAGVLHRDVKPSNVLIDSHGRALLADFGVALAANAQTRLTTTGAVVGTPGYMAPEIALGEPATPASDRYSLAVMAYELVTGRVPFSGESAIAVLHQHATQPVPSIADLLPGASQELDRVLRRGLAKRPSERTAPAMALAKELAEALDRASFASALEAAASPTRRLEPAVAPAFPARRRHRMGSLLLRGLGMTALLIVGTLGGVTLWRGLEPSLPDQATVPLAEEPTPSADRAEQTRVEAATAGLDTVTQPIATQPMATQPMATQPLDSAPDKAPVKRADQPPPARPEPVSAAPATVHQEAGPAPEPAPAAADTATEVPAGSAGELPNVGATTPLPSLGGRRLGPQRQLELMRRGQRLGRDDFELMLQRASGLSLRPAEAAKARLLMSFARGGLAYLDGRFEEAAQILTGLIAAPTLGGLGGGPGQIATMVLREHPAGTPLARWELALGFANARGDGLGDLAAPLASSPGDRRLLLGRAQLHRLDGDHVAALADAVQAYQIDSGAGRRGAGIALFVAEEHAALGHWSEAVEWYRKALAEGGRMATAAALEAARIAEEKLADRALAIEFLTTACQQGQPQACRRAERLRRSS